ncbi:hypothetical protein LSH36_356g01032 [Paralvinella palmiformis]|uniref:CARD domain-containing protein n=1 Tax=Paralvinella palmiformis TaxID=53620 RepID=A0AAD9JER0_9ANNE|nr:hypothetical protein LSH36_356g01032 [Paralvinella palmiformis]
MIIWRMASGNMITQRSHRHRFVCWLLLMLFHLGGSAYGTAEINITKLVEYQVMDVFPSKVRFTSYVYHSDSSTADAPNLLLTDGSEYFDVFFGEDFIGPSLDNPNFTVSNDMFMSWKEDPLYIGDVMNLSYVAVPNAMLPDGITILSSVVTYETDSSALVEYEICVMKKIIISENIMHQYGFVALALFGGFVTGALITIVILVIYYKVKGRTPFDSGEVEPMRAINIKMVHNVNKSAHLVTDVKGSMRKGVKNLISLGQDSADTSIVQVLTVKDKLKALRKLNDMDIGATANIDQQMENERNAGMMDATKLLIHNLAKNGDISGGVKDKCLSNFNKKVDKMDKDLNEDFKKYMETLLKELSTKNKAKLTDLSEKQEDEREAMEEKTKFMKKEERKQIMDLLNEQQETEQNELSHQLELEQKEQLEKIRKELAIRKRMGIKSLQQELLNDIKNQGQLTSEQADWLMKEHFKNQSAIEHTYDDEISRQRMMLEEKLALRRSLIENKEIQEDADNDLLNQLAEQQISLVMKGKKTNVISEDEAAAMIDGIQDDIIKTKDRLEADRQKQVEALQKKLSQRKKKRIDDLMKKQKQEISEKLKLQSQSQVKAGYTDPVSQVLTHQQLFGQHRAELTALENKIDREDVEEYGQFRNQFFEQMKGELIQKKEKLVDDLKSQGMTTKELNKILSKHEQQQEDLLSEQEQWKIKQSEKIKKQLAKRRAEWDHRRQMETVEQENLREHEDNVIRKLMDNQVALSEAERENILHEHEKQMVNIENSLTLSKLQQQRMLEERLVKKRNLQLEKLQKKHAKEAKKQFDYSCASSTDTAAYYISDSICCEYLKKLAREDDEDEDAELEMLKRQAEDRIELLRGGALKLDDDIDEIHTAMLKERANALKEQEVRLGAMLAQLQIEKAKEMAQIEHQQKAIHNLKSSLMDDLSERGMLSDPKCQKVIELHQKQQEKLNKKLENDRAKQEKALRQRLRARLRQKEQHLEELQQQEVKDVMSKMSGSSAAARLRHAALATRHMLEMEKFRNQIENEITQTLQEMKRCNELRRIETLQNQEIQFINGLVRMGKFKADELNNVILMLFPNKSEEEQKKLLENLLEGTPEEGKKKSPENDADQSIEDSTLEQRVLANTMVNLKSLSRIEEPRRHYHGAKADNVYQPVLGPPRRSLTHQRPSDVGLRDVSGDWRPMPRQSTAPAADELIATYESELTSVDMKRRLKKRGVSMMDDLPPIASDFPGVRHEPIRRYSPEGRYSDDQFDTPPPPQRLPPLDRHLRKKKLVQISQEYDS